MRPLKNLKRKLKYRLAPLFHYLFDRPKAIDEVSPEYYLSVAACVKDEGRYLREWIEYHLWAGVEHFYIYDNGSTDNTREVLSSYIERGIVTYHYWVGGCSRWEGSQQVKMYKDAVARYKYCTKWLALIDADEFIALSEEGKRLFGLNGGGLLTSLSNMSNIPALA